MQTRYSTYGIHIFKTGAMICQVLVHANAFMIYAVGQLLDENVAPVMKKSLLIPGALSMLVPMTAAAGLRMSSQLSPDGRRIVISSWSVYLWAAAFLALLESVKQAFAFGASSFFNWEVLHLIAATILLILFIASYSIRALWLFAAVTIGGAPLLAALLAPYEPKIMVQPDSNPGHLLSWAYAAVVTLLFLSCLWTILRSKALQTKHKQRLSILGFALFLAAIFLCTKLQTTWESHVLVKTFAFGALVGSRVGPHIWGIFPWSGVMALGFLIYDWILRWEGSRRVLIGLFSVGAFALAVFYGFLSDEAVEACTPTGKMTAFGAHCFSGAFWQILFMMGLFTVCAPLACLAEKWGWERRWVKVFSRAVLWIYIFETALLPFTSLFFMAVFPIRLFLWIYLGFALLTSWMIAVLIDKVPRDIHLTLRRVDPALTFRDQ